ncbi:MAG: phage virion morphogenesis protein [Desulfobacula sp.]|nr:phage virion morphogenesis protein [Desulfobacula sp.]
MTASIQVTLDDSDVMAKLADVAARGKNLAPVMAAFGDYLVKETVTRFEQEKDPDGKPWKELSAFTLKFKKGNQILTDSTDLRNSFSRKANATSVRMGTDRPYAALHQFGLKKTLKIKSHRRKVKSRSKKGVSSGVAFVKAHTRDVDTVARPFLGFTPGDRVELGEIVKEHLEL